MKAVSVPAAIVKFVESVAPEVFAEPKVGLTMTPMCGADGQSEHSSSTTPAATGDATNESARKNVVLLPYPLEIPSWCSIALMRSTFVHFAEALSSMTCRHTNRAPVITYVHSNFIFYQYKQFINFYDVQIGFVFDHGNCCSTDSSPQAVTI